MTPFAEMVAMRGKRVRAYMVEPGDEQHPDGVSVVGVLHMINEEGEFDVMDALHVMHYCWPALRMELLDESLARGATPTELRGMP